MKIYTNITKVNPYVPGKHYISPKEKLCGILYNKFEKKIDVRKIYGSLFQLEEKNHPRDALTTCSITYSSVSNLQAIVSLAAVKYLFLCLDTTVLKSLALVMILCNRR